MEIRLRNKIKILLDFDGVIVDSNDFKTKCINQSARKFIDIEKAKEFTSFFISLNGYSRMSKIEKFFGKGQLSNNILTFYNYLVSINYNNCSLTYKAKEFLEYLNQNNFEPIILSGGNKSEIHNYLKVNLNQIKFKDILGDRKTKHAWINHLLTQVSDPKQILFIGDSMVDHKAANDTYVDFILMTKYSQDFDFKITKKSLKTIDTLEMLLNKW